MAPTRRLVAAALAAVVTPLVVAPAATASSADDRPFPTRIFSSDSPFYQQLSDDTPAAWNSASLVRDLVQQTHDYYGTPTRRQLDISTHRWSPTMYVATNADPVARFSSENCQNKWNGWDEELLREHLGDVHIPADAVPDDSGDGSMVIYNKDTDTVTETWVTRKRNDGSWSACWGGTIRNASSKIGQHKGTYGVSASGLSMAGFVIRPDELARGRIDHVVALNIPRVEFGPSWPATRSDGAVRDGSALAEGQLLRLPRSVDVDAMNLSPAARTIAKAAQDYGIMITDQGGAVTFIAQNASGFDHDPYSELFRGRWAADELRGDSNRGEGQFPLEQLVALPTNYRVKADNPSGSRPQDVAIRQVAQFDDPVKDWMGNTWAARDGGTFDTKNVWNRPWWIKTTNTRLHEVYRSSVWGLHHYGVDVPNGRYGVTLYMSEDYWNAAGRRVFDVRAEGDVVLKDVDIWAEAGGMHRGLERTVYVKVTDGHLDLDWDVHRDNALLNAVEIKTL